MSEEHEHICDLPGVVKALRNASGALASQHDQIGQMSGMFDDEDGTIAAAVEDGEHSIREIEEAILLLGSLIEAEAQDASIMEALAEEAKARDAEIAQELESALKDARASNVPNPNAAMLHELARDIREELVRDMTQVEDREDAEVVLSVDAAEKAIELIMGAAVAADDASRAIVPEIVVSCYRGIVQGILVVEGQPKVLVYVQDNDLEGKDPERDNDLVLLQDEDPDRPDYFADVYTTHGDEFPSDGRRWSSMRAEADRLHARGIRADLVHLASDTTDHG